MLKKLIAAAVSLIVIGSVGAIFTAKAYFSTTTETKEFSFSGNKVQNIQVYADTAEIEFSESDSSDLVIQSLYSSNRNQAEVTLDGNTLHIKSNKKSNLNIGFSFSKGKNLIRIQVPKQTFGKINIESDLGDINLEALQTDSLAVSTETGSINVRKTQTKKIDIKSELGSVKITRSTGDINIDNEMGNVEVVADSLEHNYNISNEMGSIHISTKKEPSDLFISASSEMGSIRMFDKKTGAFRAGDQTKEMELKTEMGNITVKHTK